MNKGFYSFFNQRVIGCKKSFFLFIDRRMIDWWIFCVYFIDKRMVDWRMVSHNSFHWSKRSIVKWFKSFSFIDELSIEQWFLSISSVKQWSIAKKSINFFWSKHNRLKNVFYPLQQSKKDWLRKDFNPIHCERTIAWRMVTILFINHRMSYYYSLHESKNDILKNNLYLFHRSKNDRMNFDIHPFHWSKNIG